MESDEQPVCWCNHYDLDKYEYNDFRNNDLDNFFDHNLDYDNGL
jgi:hypothetical protein